MKLIFIFCRERPIVSPGLAVMAGALTLVLAMSPAPPAAAADSPDVEELRRRVAALEQEIDRRQAEGGESARTAELERRIDLLAAEIEALRSGGAAADDETVVGVKGLAPAASRVYRKARGVSLGGYGEALYSNFAARAEDGSSADATDVIDLVRQIVYVGYKFSDTILLNSEIEFEHASTEHGGAVSVEFAYLEFQKRREIGVRAGLLLVPVGLLNELHEPPIFHGAHRPEVERAILPTTWGENGIGLFGEVGPVQWRTYLVAGLSSAGFSADGVREGRQSGAESRAEDLAVTGRVDFTGTPGLLAGGSFFTGRSGQGAVVEGQRVRGRVSLFDLHARYQYRGLELRALWARGTLSDAALVDRQNGLLGAESVGDSQAGWYVEAAFDVMSLKPRGGWSIIPFVRYEELDTQRSVPAGYERDPSRDRGVFTGGFEIKPIPQVVFKLDYEVVKNQARTGVNRFNVAAGYLF